MPALFACMIVMVGYAAAVGDFGAAARFLLEPDFSRLTGEAVLTALGQAFFSVGIAMAVHITYGSFLDRRTSIPRNAFIVVGADSLVALLAGFAIFPIVFAHGLPLNSGEGLVFETLPIAFGDLPGGRLFGSVFFLLLIAAAMTSCISNFAPIVAWTRDRFDVSHTTAALASGAAMWALGLGTVFSFNLLAGFHPFSFIGLFADRTIYESLDFIMSNVLLPAGAFLTSIFIGWIAGREGIREELGTCGRPCLPGMARADSLCRAVRGRGDLRRRRSRINARLATSLARARFQSAWDPRECRIRPSWRGPWRESRRAVQGHRRRCRP